MEARKREEKLRRNVKARCFSQDGTNDGDKIRVDPIKEAELNYLEQVAQVSL